jgi:ferredoxin
MVRSVADSGKIWSMYYLGRSRSTMALLGEIQSISGGPVDIVPEDERGMLDIPGLLGGLNKDIAVYCCGPEPLLRAVENVGLPRGVLHLERFGRPITVLRTTGGSLDQRTSPKPIANPVAVGGHAPSDGAIEPGAAFEVELAASGVVLDIGPGESILGRARAVRQGLSFSCTEGYCGTCETAVLRGVPDHRDTVLSDEEKDAGKTMMICVGRSRTRRLVLDL